MSIDKTIDDLYDILDNSWHLPISGGKVIIDSKEVRCLLEDLRLKLPKEITQAKNIVADRSKIIDDAKLESERILKATEDKARSMLNQNEIVRNSQQIANKIISDAKTSSKEIKLAANQYVDNIMKEAEQVISSRLSDIKKARQAVKSSDS